MAPTGVRLGVDVGTVRMGVARCDPDGVLATPLRTVQRDPKRNSDLRVIVKDALELAAVTIYVGLPQTLRGGESGSAALARELAQLLAGLLRDVGSTAEVRLIDERLSSVTAHQQLRSVGMAGREQRKVVDQVAAAGILQHALEMEKSRGSAVGETVVAQPRSAKSRAEGDGGQ